MSYYEEYKYFSTIFTRKTTIGVAKKKAAPPCTLKDSSIPVNYIDMVVGGWGTTSKKIVWRKSTAYSKSNQFLETVQRPGLQVPKSHDQNHRRGS